MTGDGKKFAPLVQQAQKKAKVLGDGGYDSHNHGIEAGIKVRGIPSLGVKGPEGKWCARIWLILGAGSKR